MEKKDLKQFYRDLEEFDIVLSSFQVDQFLTYYELLIEKNKVMNLTAITDFEEVLKKHFIDSLSLVKVCDLKDDISLLDVGTGAGFPGIPLKIAFPALKVTLLDSLNKRVNFLQEVIESLELDDIEALHGRAEDFAKPNLMRKQFDLCVSRAVAYAGADDAGVRGDLDASFEVALLQLGGGEILRYENLRPVFGRDTEGTDGFDLGRTQGGEWKHGCLQVSDYDVANITICR